uniref:Uncharacterized protein n=1 Tax=Arundo donax TaxID=35708 RepID=A0A0A9EP57_ARUDO
MGVYDKREVNLRVATRGILVDINSCCTLCFATQHTR